MKALLNLIEKTVEQSGVLKFDIGSVKTKMFGTGNVGFRATLEDGRHITFFQSTMDGVVEEIDDTTYKLKPGVQLAWSDRDQAYGLIDPSKVAKSIWD